MFQIWQSILLLQVIEWNRFIVSIYCLSKFIFNWMLCILFAKSGNLRSHCLLREAQGFHVYFGWYLQLQECLKRKL